MTELSNIYVKRLDQVYDIKQSQFTVLQLVIKTWS